MANVRQASESQTCPVSTLGNEQGETLTLSSNGDVLLAATSFGLIMSIFHLHPAAVTGATARKSLNWLSSNKYEDPLVIQNSKL